MITHITQKETEMQTQIDDLKREVLAYSISLENAEMFVSQFDELEPIETEPDYKREALAWSITAENLEAGHEMA